VYFFRRGAIIAANQGVASDAATPGDTGEDLIGLYQRRPQNGQPGPVEWWRVSRSERDTLFRVERGQDEAPAEFDMVLDRDNLLSKLHKWQREGFAPTHGQAGAKLPATDFMAELSRARERRDSDSDSGNGSRLDQPGDTLPGAAHRCVTIGGVAVPRGAGGPLTPRMNPAYLFAAHHADVIRDLVENRRVMLIGHTGSGKTSLIEQVAAGAGQGVIRVNMNGQTTIGDFVGFWTVKGGATVWVDGVLPVAMRDGLWLIIDEIDFAEPGILAVLTAVLEPHGKLLLKEKGNEVVAPDPAFRLAATANAVGAMSRYRHLYQGANLMNEAFLDRWRVYQFDYLSPADEAQVLVRTLAPYLSPALAHTLVAIAADCRAAFEREDLASAFSTRRLLDWAELMLRLGDPERAAEPTIYSKISPEDAAVIRGIMRHHILLPG
jgi:cobaltochelatase CobS